MLDGEPDAALSGLGVFAFVVICWLVLPLLALGWGMIAEWFRRRRERKQLESALTITARREAREARTGRERYKRLVR